MPDSVSYYVQLGYAYAQKQGLKKYMSKALSRKAEVYKIKGNYNACAEYCRQSLKLSREANYKKGVAGGLVNLGNVYSYWGDHNTALRYFYEARRMFEEMGDRSREAIALSNIAGIYYSSGKKDSAIDILKRCVAIQKIANDKLSLATNCQMLGSFYYHLYKPYEAAYYIEKAEAVYTEINNQVGIGHCYYHMGQIYYDKSDSVRSEIMLQKGLAIGKKFGDSALIGGCLQALAFLSHALKKTDKAILLSQQALQIFKSQKIGDMSQSVALFLSKWNIEQHNYKAALEMYKLHITFRDSSNGNNSRSALYREQLKYDFEKKELLAKAALEKKLSLIKADAEREKLHKDLWLAGSVTLLLILLLISYFAYNHFRQKNIIASQKNNLLKQQLLVSQMNPHFIFNSLNAVQNFIYKQDSYQAGVYLNKFSGLIRMILDFSRENTISLENEITFLQDYLALQKLRFNEKLNYEIKVDPLLEPAMIMIPPMLAQPFIENAIEHGIFYKDGEGFLSIRISLVKNMVVYEIEDNGIGFGESMKLKRKVVAQHRSLAIKITKERLSAMNDENSTGFEIEIMDKSLLHKETTGVYVKFATPYLTL